MVESDNVIWFYDQVSERTKEENIYLNNFAESKFTDQDNISYLSVEHYYQAHKFSDFSVEGFKDIFNEINNAENADKCKKLSRKYTKSIDPKLWNKEEWDKTKKEFIMKRALVYKFSQNKDLLIRLMSTGDSILKEESSKDLYWGGLVEGSLNRLGALLMELRANYKNTGYVFLEGSGLDRVKVELMVNL